MVGGAQGEHVHTAENIRRGVENSLRLLKTDHLDLVQFHRSLTQEEFEKDGALQEAIKLRGEGKVRFLGVSGTLPNLVEQIEMGVFDAFQIPYSALQRDHEDVITKAAQAGAGTIIRGGVARGAPTDRLQVRVGSAYGSVSSAGLFDAQRMVLLTFAFRPTSSGLDEAQRATIEAWAAREGVQIAAWHVDAGVPARAQSMRVR